MTESFRSLDSPLDGDSLSVSGLSAEFHLDVQCLPYLSPDPHPWRSPQSVPQLLVDRRSSPESGVRCTYSHGTPDEHYAENPLCAVPRLPDWLSAEMLVNQVITCVCGMFPILGDLIVAIFGCNSRNVALLEEYLAIRGSEYLRPDGDRRYDPEDIKPGVGMERGESPSYHPTPATANPDQEPLINSKDWEV